MRPHGKARVDKRSPRAHAICDRCGFRYAHADLSWDVQWIGPRLQNLRFLVCPTCLDKPQEGLRTIVLPQDPVPIINARPENFVDAANPISGIGFDLATMTAGLSASGNGVPFGTMLQGGGIIAAFDQQSVKPAWRSANTAPSAPGLVNTVGCKWNNDPATFPLPSVLGTAALQSYSIKSVTVQAPSDAPFLSSGSATAAFQGSNDGQSWTNLWSGTTAGTIGETLVIDGSVNLVMTNYAAHQFVINGDGLSTVAIAQLILMAAGPSAAQAAGVET